MVEIHRIWRFCASHRLHRADWSEERNNEVYGSSARAPGHGHNFRLGLTLRGEPDPTSGRLVDLRALDAAVEERVLTVYDHKNLNADVPSLAGSVPTLERLLADVAERLRGAEATRHVVAIELEVDEFLRGRLLVGPTDEEA